MVRAHAAPLSTWQWSALLLGLGLLWWLSITELTGSPITKDAGENLQMGLALAHHGVVSLDKSPPYRPSMMREPVPVTILAGAVLLTDGVLGRAQYESYFSGVRARYLKFSNLLWLTLLTASTFLAIRHFTSTFWLAMLGGALVALHFTRFVPVTSRSFLGIDNLYTEVAGAALLTTASLLLAVGVAGGQRLAMVGAGVFFALAALTKAALFYVCIGALGAACLYYAVAMIHRRARATRQLLFMLGALSGAFLLVTVPWLYRNHVQTGFFQIAERSGSVLMHRALLDQMSPSEFVGGFAVWGNQRAARVVSLMTGYTAADLKSGGRLQRLAEQFSGPAEQHELLAEDSGRPDEAVTWYRKARAAYEARLTQFTRAGYPYPSGAADFATRNEAIGRIAKHPLKHLAVTPLLIWRGATLIFPILAIAVIYAWRRRRPDLLVFALPGLGLTLFYGAASQFPPRFGYVIYPIAVVVFLTMLAAVRWPPRRGGS